MDVTISNFKSALPLVEKAIEESTFLSIDCELTGLNTVRNIHAFDSVEEYYGKVRYHCKDFLVIQYGISAFRYDKDSNKFKQKSFNFYVFRSPINGNIPDQRFLCQTSSIQFLISQGFDFNKLYKEGIPYLNTEELTTYQKCLEESYQRRKNVIQSQENGTYEVIPVPDNAQEFIDNVRKQIDTFLETEDVELELPKCNAFLRRLIYQIRSADYSNKISLETRQVDRDRILFATKLKNKKQLEEIEKQRYEKELTIADDFEGFSKVIKAIVKSGKLVIGHNLCLDFLHTIDKFLTPLPEDYEEFKEMAHCLFNNVLDTKYMANNRIFSDKILSHVLKDLLETVSKKPFDLPIVEIEDGSEGYSLSEPKEHEAGYDAFITGLSFLGMWQHLGAQSGLNSEETFSKFDLLEPFLNRIYLMNLADNQYINLAGDDLNPSRDHVFYLTFPKEWKQNNIVQLFSPFGNVYISWIDESSAYVALNKRDQAATALSTLSQSESYKITTFAKRKAFLAGITMPSKSPIATRGKKRRSCDEEVPLPPTTKRNSLNRIIAVPRKRSIDPIREERIEPEEGDEAVVKRSKKTFNENDSWE